MHFYAQGKYSNILALLGMKKSINLKYWCKRVQKFGQKCKNSSANLYSINLPHSP